MNSSKRDALELAEHERHDLESRFKPAEAVEDSDFSLSEAVADQRAEEENQPIEVEEQAPAEQSEAQVKEIIEAGDVDAFDRILDQDFEVSRRNIMTIVDKHDEIIDVLLTVARESESPRAFEVLNQTLTHMIESNKQVMDLYEKREIVKEKHRKNAGASQSKNYPDGQYTQNNNYVFTGSTSDLLKQINEKMNSTGNTE